MWTSYMEPQPPLTSTTAISVAFGKAVDRIFIRFSSAAFWKFVLEVLKWKTGTGIALKFCCSFISLVKFIFE